jgi:enoyl-[acyl-carrier protein] reductase/trans-2-enoyl-CoA reductase (NAD+)
MIIHPKVRGFVCVTTHPTGCEANTREQIETVKSAGSIAGGPRNALVIGASTGYGLASRITAAFGCGAGTVGVFLEREPTEKRPATAGWYNAVAFERAARAQGLAAASVNGDAFSDEVKSRTVAAVRETTGPVDLVVYSVAAPRRIHPRTGADHRSVLKPIGDVYRGKTLNTDKATVTPVEIEPAGEKEIADTVAVMGGEDWRWWIDALEEGGVLADGCRTIAFTYIGPELTWPIYWDGTIGKAKDDLDQTARALDDRLGARGGSACVAVMKAVVTQASSAIPVVPLYISLLFKVMKERAIHEGPIEQARRMFAERLYAGGGGGPVVVDETGRVRMDDLEMRGDVQGTVNELWPRITTENLRELTDFDGYQHEFLRLFGFDRPDVDYDADVDPMVLFDE